MTDEPTPTMPGALPRAVDRLDEAKWEKLPGWARADLRNLRAEVDALRAALDTAAPKDCDTWSDPFGYPAPIGAHPTVRHKYRDENGRERYVDVSFEGGVLDVRGESPGKRLVVMPVVSNAVRIALVPYAG